MCISNSMALHPVVIETFYLKSTSWWMFTQNVILIHEILVIFHSPFWIWFSGSCAASLIQIHASHIDKAGRITGVRTTARYLYANRSCGYDVLLCSVWPWTSIPVGHAWLCLALYGSTWITLSLFIPAWVFGLCLALFSTVRSYLVVLSPVRSCMALWSTFFWATH